MEKLKCPEIRFGEFGGEWSVRSWRDTVDISTNMVDPRINEYSELFHVGPGNIESFIGQFYNNVLKVKDSNLISGKFYFKKGDIIYGKINPQLAKYVIAPFEGLASADAYVLNTKNGVIQNYLYAILQTKDFYKYTVSVSSRTGMPKINRDELNIYNYLSPSEAEQTQIGNFFQNLDQSIALQNKKLAQTQNLKKAMLEKMFPKTGSTQPEIRLKGFSGDWELQPLESVFGKIRNAFVGTATPYYVKSGRFYLESNNVKDGKINRKSEIFINDYFYYKQQDKWLKTNDIVMVQSGHVGHAAVIPKELNNSAAHALIMFTDYKVDADPHFINYQIQTYKAKNEIDKITTGNTIKHILSSDMKKFSLLFPCVNEQKQLGNFFKKLDETLALQQQQLQTLKNLKQAFLEKMFV